MVQFLELKKNKQCMCVLAMCVFLLCVSSCYVSIIMSSCYVSIIMSCEFGLSSLYTVNDNNVYFASVCSQKECNVYSLMCGCTIPVCVCFRILTLLIYSIIIIIGIPLPIM